MYWFKYHGYKTKNKKNQGYVRRPYDVKTSDDSAAGGQTNASDKNNIRQWLKTENNTGVASGRNCE